ncbi:MAG: hypothetical protein EOP06_11895 [Proteobacteria bacterium]|nr:MAG: hypothetical protein EOP06_11895 [Pseudomonadota bacterium]
MSTSFSMALAIKELEPGEYHWILLDEASSEDDLLSYAPQAFSDPYKNAAAAWAAGYLMVRATLRKASPE